MDIEHFKHLCQAQVEGTATDEERTQFYLLLDESEEARVLYVEQMRIHAALTWLHGRSAVPAGQRKPDHKILQFPRLRWLVGAVAASILLAGSATWWLWHLPASGVSVEVVAAQAESFRAGDRLTCRALELERGSLSFRLDSGALVDVSGPARLELISPMHLRVIQGVVTADIGQGAKGFVIDTAQARVVDLGTRFSVSAEALTGTQVVVFEGEIEVFDPSGKITRERPKITLTEGEALRLRPASRPDRLRMVPLQPNARSMRDGHRTDIVSNIEDNVTDAGFRGYYGLLRGGFGEGARAYTTGHTRTWHAMPGESFPADLLGADGICTFGMDGKEANLEISLHISRPCNVYIMADARTAAPEWLQEAFTDTEFRLRCGPWIPRGTPKDAHSRYYADPAAYVPYTVWRRRVVAPSVVKLGSPLTHYRPKSQAMYGIAVKAL